MTSSSQDSDASLNFNSLATLKFSTPTVEDRELEMLMITSIQTLKRGNKKCGNDEVLGYLEILRIMSLRKLLKSFWSC